MGIILDKINYMTVTHSCGFYEDNNGVMYPFAVEVVNEQGMEEDISVIWDDDVPEGVEELEKEIIESITEDEEER